MNYAVILAGGTGKRLWPLSRHKRPKQVLKLFENQTLLRQCFERLLNIFDERNILILTNADFAETIRDNISELPYGNIIAEPAVRDTAGAIGLAATILSKYDPNATMAILTADQQITPDETIQQALDDAISYVNENPETLLTFGIKPKFPSTQLGYINCTDPQKHPSLENKIYDVKSFTEKPDEETAKKYIEQGNYFWNSGMFVWKARTILNNLKKYLPQCAEPLEKIKKNWETPNQKLALNEWFEKLPKISIDYAVMEKAENVKAIELDCNWLDMGSFTSLADVIKSDENNNIVVAAESELMDCSDSILVTEDSGHLIAGIGLEKMVVAHANDVTLVCPISQIHRIKELLKKIKDEGKEKYL